MTSTALVRIAEASRALEKATDVRDVARIRNQAEVLRVMAQRAHAGLEAQNRAAELRLRAERKAGELLIVMSGNGARKRGSKESHGATLSDLGIDKHQSSRWQLIARLPADAFEQYIATRRESSEEITTAGILSRRTGFVGFSSETAEWYSPDIVIAKSLDVLGRIDLDPCAEPATIARNLGVGARHHNIPALRHYTLADDGLSKPWIGTVYMNPPYGDEIPLWIEKLVEEHRDGRTPAAIALTPARTDTAWFRMLRDFPRCFVSGRLVFKMPAGREVLGQSAPFPSALFGLGVPRKSFLRVFGELGDIYERAA